MISARGLFQSLLAVIVMMVSSAIFAQDEWREGEHYDLIKPEVRMATSDKVVVTEFFWYGCGHCYTFEPMLEAWKQSMPGNMVLEPSPAMWNGAMQLHAQAFYTAQVLGVLDTMHSKIFSAMHTQRQRLGNKESIRELFVANGVSEDEFNQAFDSFGVGSQVRQADARARAAKITGTPALMVAGKYLISARKAGSQANMIKIAEFLADKESADAS